MYPLPDRIKEQIKISSEPTISPALIVTLELAVPEWQLIIKRNYDYYFSQKDKWVDTIANSGDIILYKSSKKGETARAFNDLAKAIALLSFSPLGIDIFGLHFEAKLND
jgi:hypothetical protein